MNLLALVLLLAAAIPNPLHVYDGPKQTGDVSCQGSWLRVSGITKTSEPAVLDNPADSKTPPNAMLYCRDADGHAARITAKPETLLYPAGTLIQPVYKLTIDHPAADSQAPFDTYLGPDGSIAKAPFGQAVIFGKHSMLVVPDGWKIESHVVGVLPKRPDTYTPTLDEGGCEVNKMDDEDAYPRYIGTAATDCSVKIDLNSLQ